MTDTEDRVEQMQRERLRYGPDREDAAKYSAMIVSGGISTLLATWGSGVLASGLPRVGYFLGIVVTLWFFLGWGITKALLAVDGWSA